MLSIFKKEISVYLSSMAAYVAIGVFLLLMSLLLWVFPDTSIPDYGYASLDSFFNTSPFLFFLLIPALTMRAFAEERREGTFELLVSKPLSDWQIVLGKYFAATAMIVMALLPTVIYYVSVYQLGTEKGNLDTGAIIGSYIGLLFLGSTFSAIGIFASATTKNQVIAFAIAVFLCYFMFSGFGAASKILSFHKYDWFLISLGGNEHYQSLSRGVLDSRDLIYFISVNMLFLLITKTVLGSRKW